MAYTIQRWVGFGVYVVNEQFLVMAVIYCIIVGLYMPVYVREITNNMYQVEAYLFGRFVVQCLVYPTYSIFTAVFAFHFFGMLDDSWENAFLWFMTCMSLILAGSTFGLMCGAIFNEQSAALSFTTGMGSMLNLSSGLFATIEKGRAVKYISYFTPYRYGVELMTRRILSKHVGKNLVLALFNLNYGDRFCLGMMFLWSGIYLCVAWLALRIQKRNL